MLAFTSMLECLSKYHAFAGVPSPAFGASPCRVKEARFFTSEALLAEREERSDCEEQCFTATSQCFEIASAVTER